MAGKFKKSLVIGGLLAIFFIQATTSMVQKSPTADEAAHHIAPGYSFLKTRDFRLNSTGPPLMEELAALPLLFMSDLKLPLEHLSWDRIQRTEFGWQFLYVENKDKIDSIVFWSRIPIVLTGVFLGYLVFLWSNKLYGIKSGTFALFLYAFSPTILAHTRLVTMDMGASCFIFLAIFCFYLYCKNPSFGNLILSGLAFGLAQLSKYTAVYLYFVYPLFFLLIWFFSKKDFMVDYMVCRNIRKFLYSIVLIFIIGNFVVFCGYFFELKPLLLNDIDVGEKITFFETFVTKVFGGNSDVLKMKVVDFALNQPVPFSTYIMGFLGATNQTFVEHKFDPMLFGKYYPGGLWYYYLVVFGLKTSLPVLLLLALVIVLYKRVAGKIFDELFTVIPVVVLMLFASLTILQSGQRYILPIYPFLFVYISKIVNLPERHSRAGVNVPDSKGFTHPIRKGWLTRNRATRRVSPTLLEKYSNWGKRRFVYLLILFLGFCYLFSSVKTFPHYLPYFNILGGGADNGYKYLTRVNTDLGQDLKGLANYLDENNINRVKLSYWGFAPPEIYNINCLPIKDSEKEIPEKDVYAISVHHIDEFEWTKKVKPGCKIGYSIFIYDFRYR